MSDDPLEWKIQTLRGQLLELGSAIRQLNQSGLDSATAQLLLSRKRAELEDLMKRGRSDGRPALADSKTGQKNIPLGPPALELLNSLASVMTTEWVFPARSGPGPFMGVEKVWNRIRERAGFPELRIHDLRHSFASMGLAGGSTLTVIGALLGHSDVKTTAQYAHLSADPVRTAADRISGAMATAMGGASMNADIVQLDASRKRA